jgi:hypothetical protein
MPSTDFVLKLSDNHAAVEYHLELTYVCESRDALSSISVFIVQVNVVRYQRFCPLSTK